MKNFVSILLIIILSFVLASCTKKNITSNDLQLRNGIAFNINSDKPFSGEVIDYKTEKSKDIVLREIYKNGYKDGECYYEEPNGNIVYATFQHGKLNGVKKEYYSKSEYPYEDHPYKFTNYISGIKNGACTEYSYDRRTQIKKNYKDDRLIMFCKQSASGEKQFEFAVIDSNNIKDIVPVKIYNASNDLKGNIYLLRSYIFPLNSLLYAYGGGKSRVINYFGKPTSIEHLEHSVRQKYLLMPLGVENISGIKLVKMYYDMMDLKMQKLGTSKDMLVIEYWIESRGDLSTLQWDIASALKGAGFTLVNKNDEKRSIPEQGIYDIRTAEYENTSLKIRISEESEENTNGYQLSYIISKI